jgi:hypothetical protein
MLLYVPGKTGNKGHVGGDKAEQQASPLATHIIVCATRIHIIKQQAHEPNPHERVSSPKVISMRVPWQSLSGNANLLSLKPGLELDLTQRKMIPLFAD